MSRFSPRRFPRLGESNHRVTSASDIDYNCIAWAADDILHWWQPGFFWPAEAGKDEYGIDVLERLFISLGYEDCGTDDRSEMGYRKVALYGSSMFYTHAAKQTAEGKWSSKLGKAEDIEHESSDDVAGGIYGEVVAIMKRKVV